MSEPNETHADEAGSRRERIRLTQFSHGAG